MNEFIQDIRKIQEPNFFKQGVASQRDHLNELVSAILDIKHAADRFTEDDRAEKLIFYGIADGALVTFHIRAEQIDDPQA